MKSKKVYIVGSKGIPASYGGFETFLDRLVSGKKSSLDYVITGMGHENKEYSYKGARCVQFKTGDSVISRMLHTVKALLFVVKAARSDNNPGSNKIIYILGCRAGIFLPIFRPAFKRLNVTILSNPDGAEWKRAKWNAVAKSVVWLYELLLIKSSDLVVCDAQAMLEIIHESFSVPKEKMTFIAYGSDIYNPPKQLSKELLKKYIDWLIKNSLESGDYYLMVGRFVPENNYELAIREFMKSDTTKDLVIISNVEGSKYFNILRKNTGFENDPRIKFVGTLYDQDLLKLIRSKATANIHGHEVGGTNPSLLEALGSTDVNLVYDVSFNREVVGSAGYYFNNSAGNLAQLVSAVDILTNETRSDMGARAKKRIKKHYSWHDIVTDYEKLFNNYRTENIRLIGNDHE